MVLILMIKGQDIGDIKAKFTTYMAYIWLKSSNLSVRYDLGIVLVRIRGAAMISKLSTFQIFPNFGKGGIKFTIFPIFQSVYIIQG